MRLSALFLGLLTCVALTSLASAQGGAKKGGKSKAPAKEVSKCVEVRTEAIYAAYGYDHHVYLNNGCDKAVRCEVTTNSNPEVTTAVLEAGDKQDIVMFRGSPANEVSANVKCAARDDV